MQQKMKIVKILIPLLLCITGTIVCCIPPSTPAVRAISTTCPAHDPSCVTSPPSTETIGNVRQSLHHAKFAVRVSV